MNKDGSVQDSLFEVHDNTPDVGYRAPIASSVASVSYRQLDYWARTDLVKPSIQTAHGSGSQRLYSFRDILVLKIVKGLLDTGISLQNIRKAVEQLSDLGVHDLAGVTLVSDGKTVYLCRSSEDVIDLLSGGQSLFAIGIPSLVKELSGDIAELPTEAAEDVSVIAMDELAARRAFKIVS